MISKNHNSPNVLEALFKNTHTHTHTHEFPFHLTVASKYISRLDLIEKYVVYLF